MIDYLIFAACFAIFLIIAVLYLYKSSRNITTIPGPEPVDLLEGNLPDIKSSGGLNNFLMKLHEEYGDIARFWYGSTFCVSISTPQLFKDFSSAFDRPYGLKNAELLLWGEDSIEFNHGIVARKKLQNYAKFFLPQQSQIHLKHQEIIIDKAMDSWSRWPKGTLFPLHNQLFKLCIECFSRSFLGDLLMVEELKDLYKHLKNIWLTIEKYSIDSLNVDDLMEQQFKSSREYLIKIINKSVDLKHPSSFSDICQASTFGDSNFIADFLTYFTEAIYKTTSLCTWACHHISQDKEIQDKLIRMITSDETEISYKAQKCEYLRLVLLETMRCVPIVSYTYRFQEFETILAGHKVPENTSVLHALGVHFQDSEYFDNPSKFNPERDNIKENNGDLTFTPFGFSGKRACPAKDYSMQISSIILSKIFSKFYLESQDSIFEVQQGFYPHPSDDIWITIKSL